MKKYEIILPRQVPTLIDFINSHKALVFFYVPYFPDYRLYYNIYQSIRHAYVVLAAYALSIICVGFQTPRETSV